METIYINLPEDVWEWAQSQVAVGRASSVDDYFTQLMLFERDRALGTAHARWTVEAANRSVAMSDGA